MDRQSKQQEAPWVLAQEYANAYTDSSGSVYDYYPSSLAEARRGTNW